jgi:hypothetical protein
MQESRTKLLRRLRNPGELEKLVDRLYVLSQLYLDELQTAEAPARTGEYLLEKLLHCDDLTDRLVQIEAAESPLTEQDNRFLRAFNIRPW